MCRLGAQYKIFDWTSCCTYFYRQNSRKSSAEEFIFDYIALHIECQFNKNSLLQCYFLTLLPAGLKRTADNCIYTKRMFYLLKMLSIKLIWTVFSTNANRDSTTPWRTGRDSYTDLYTRDFGVWFLDTFFALHVTIFYIFWFALLHTFIGLALFVYNFPLFLFFAFFVFRRLVVSIYVEKFSVQKSLIFVRIKEAILVSIYRSTNSS